MWKKLLLVSGLLFSSLWGFSEPARALDPSNCVNLSSGFIRDGVTSCGYLLAVGSDGSLAVDMYNGSTWDSQFTCTSTATVSVTAAATTEIVALTASQVIRVCGFSVSMSAAGTAKWLYGSGTNCGTGGTDITAATNLATATPWTYSTSNGSVFRTASGKALCLAAVTGNVVGVVTYAKY